MLPTMLRAILLSPILLTQTDGSSSSFIYMRGLHASLFSTLGHGIRAISKEY
jgi:hypothetical protein